MNSENIINTFEKLIYWSGERYKLAKEYGTNQKLYIAEIHAIELIGKHSGILQRDLCEMMGITKGRMSIVISNLCKKGFVEKTDDLINRKELPLRLTSQGHIAFQFHDTQEQVRMDAINKVLNRCSDDEIEKFAGILEDVLEILQEK
jgi:DNA-binding MarR family transcriptional regulator